MTTRTRANRSRLELGGFTAVLCFWQDFGSKLHQEVKARRRRNSLGVAGSHGSHSAAFTSDAEEHLGAVVSCVASIVCRQHITNE